MELRGSPVIPGFHTIFRRRKQPRIIAGDDIVSRSFSWIICRRTIRSILGKGVRRREKRRPPETAASVRQAD
jgi:hypothetical protein